MDYASEIFSVSRPCVVSPHYLDVYESRNRELEAIKKLFSAMVRRGILDLTHPDRNIRHSAQAWINNHSLESPGISFDTCCELLEIDLGRLQVCLKDYLTSWYKPVDVLRVRNWQARLQRHS